MSFLQQFILPAAGIILLEEYTNAVTELTASAINNIADFFSGINGCFVRCNESKSKKLQCLAINVKLIISKMHVEQVLNLNLLHQITGVFALPLKLLRDH